METVWRKAFDPETGLEYQIEMPAPAEVRKTILELPCPPNGMMPKETSKRLAEKLELSEEQKNAGYKGGDNIFYFMVAEEFSYLLQAGKLKQPGGPRTPYFPVDEPTTPDQIEVPAPAVVRQAITHPSHVFAKITEIAEKSADGDYIYRGESDSDPHDKVRSSLYREYETDIEAKQFDIAVVQAEILREAKGYTPKTDEFKILTELQHYGGKTNLIDFTEDYRVALFFACDSNRDKPGRVILLKKESEDYEVLKPPGTIPRAGVQKSLFVQSPTGVVEPDAVVDIPADLKGIMLHHLQKHHGISPETIYNDLLGFIENRRTHKSAYTEFYKGITCQERGHSEKEAEKQEWYDKAIGHYAEAIGLKPELAIAYNNRGIAYNDIGEVDRAIIDYNKAIKFNPKYAEAYNNRGIAYRREGEVNRAIQDYNKAIELNPAFAKAYYNRGLAYRREGEVDRAIQDFNTVIELNPELAEAYTNRGTVYSIIGDFETAIEDFSTAIDLKPEDADAYTNRGEAWLHLSEWENAKADLITAKNMGVDIVDSFHIDYESVAAFEAKHGVQVPEDIAALLSLHFEAVETKPLVLTEGKTDALYIRTALELLGEAELLNSLEIRPVGKEGNKGDKGGGQTGLNNFHNVYAAHPLSFNHAILLLYDWDANKSSEQIEKLWIRSMPKNSEDTEEKSGIENLFPSHLFEDRFYEEKTRKGIHGKSTVYYDFKKPEFCDWICEDRKNLTDFAKFDSIVQILKEFVEAN